MACWYMPEFSFMQLICWACVLFASGIRRIVKRHIYLNLRLLSVCFFFLKKNSYCSSIVVGLLNALSAYSRTWKLWINWCWSSCCNALHRVQIGSRFEFLHLFYLISYFMSAVIPERACLQVLLSGIYVVFVILMSFCFLFLFLMHVIWANFELFYVVFP